MSIPYNDKLSWQSYVNHPNWHLEQKDQQSVSTVSENTLLKCSVIEVLSHMTSEPIWRSVQFVRDAARLILKVPARSLYTPVFLEKNWRERERAKVNIKLTAYSFVQLISVPVKFAIALSALTAKVLSVAIPRLKQVAQTLLESNKSWTAFLDGRASQLEALKEVGRKGAKNKEEFMNYRQWLYSIEPALCRA